MSNGPPCSVGECTKPATRSIEIRRSAEEPHPAEVRAVCADPLCMHVALLSASGLDVRLPPPPRIPRDEALTVRPPALPARAS